MSVFLAAQGLLAEVMPGWTPGGRTLGLSDFAPGAGRLTRLASLTGRDELYLSLLPRGVYLSYLEGGRVRLEAHLRVGRDFLIELGGDAARGTRPGEPTRLGTDTGPGAVAVALLATCLARRTSAFLTIPAIRPALDRARQHLAHQVDREAWQPASQFHRAARWNIYRLLVTDPTGRLAQLVDTCPGVLTLLAKLEQARIPDTGRLVKAAVDGMVLRKLVDEVLEVYLHSCALPAESEDRDRSTCRLLVMRAGPLVPAGSILPSSRGFLVDDIPRADPRTNLVWYRAMSALALASNPRRAFQQETRRQLARHVSRHLVELQAIADKMHHHLDGADTLDTRFADGELQLHDDSTSLGWLLTRFLHYLDNTKRWPVLSTPPDRLVSRMIRWEREVLLEYYVEFLAGPCGAGALPALPCTQPDLVIEEFTTWDQLLKESYLMEHCVHSMVASHGGLEGDVVIHATWQEHHATALLTRGDEGWSFVEVSGPRNALLPAGFRKVLDGWLDGVNGNGACIAFGPVGDDTAVEGKAGAP
ncbi:MAG: hypothetical protein ABIJ09_02775 [Pseudomonadota bacterium]